MNFDEAMHAARKGHKVTTANGKINGVPFFVCYWDELGYRRVVLNKFGSLNDNFVPGVYEKMSPWVIYKKDPFASIRNAFKQVFGKLRLNFSSNPS